MPGILRVAPVLLVRDLAASLTFWRERAGFESAGSHEEYTGFAMVARGGATVMLVQVPPGREPPAPNWTIAGATNQMYLWTDDASALYHELRGRGAPIDFELYDTPWGTREFGIQDPDGNDVAFGQVLE